MRSDKWKNFFMKKLMLIDDTAKKKSLLSSDMLLTVGFYLLTKSRTSSKDSTPPPRRSLSGRSPWKPSFSQSLVVMPSGHSLSKYSLYRAFTKSQRSFGGSKKKNIGACLKRIELLQLFGTKGIVAAAELLGAGELRCVSFRLSKLQQILGNHIK
jgi:hypothetical protein